MWRVIRVIVIAIALSGLAPGTWASDVQPDSARAMAEKALDNNDFDRALVLFEQAVQAAPEDRYLLSVTARLAKRLKKHAIAVKYMERLLPIAVDSLPLRQDLLVQYLHLKDHDNHARIRAELVNLWKKSADPKKEPTFVRDFFEQGKWQVVVVEYYELKGDLAKRYVFSIYEKGAEKPSFSISLGSYKSTDAIDREQNPNRGFERLFHLDAYGPSGHRTLGFFHDEPSYAVVKKQVLEELKRN